MQKSLSSSSSSSSSLFLLLLLLSLLFQLTYSLCWEQAFINNTVFINTLSSTTGNDNVQMGYLSQVNKINMTSSGMPKITPQLLKLRCDKLSVKICAAVQFFQVPGSFGDENLSLDWGNFLTKQEYRSTRKQGTILPSGEEVTGIAYKRIRCPQPPLNGDPNHTNFNLVHPITRDMLSYFGFTSILLNYFNSFFHTITTTNNNNNDYDNNNEYLTEAEQEEEDFFFNQVDKE